MLQKDIERFEIFGIDGKWLIKDNKQLPNLLDCYQSCARLNQQDQRIAELEEQLANSIRPKFKKGQEVWFVYDDSDTWDADYKVFHKKVMAISYNNYEGNHFEYAMSDDGTRDTIWYGYIDEKFVFATKEEALKKLKELQGENK